MGGLTGARVGASSINSADFVFVLSTKTFLINQNGSHQCPPGWSSYSGSAGLEAFLLLLRSLSGGFKNHYQVAFAAWQLDVVAFARTLYCSQLRINL